MNAQLGFERCVYLTKLAMDLVPCGAEATWRGFYPQGRVRPLCAAHAEDQGKQAREAHMPWRFEALP